MKYLMISHMRAPGDATPGEKTLPLFVSSGQGVARVGCSGRARWLAVN